MSSHSIKYTETVKCTKGNEKTATIDDLREIVNIKKMVGLYEIIDIDSNEWVHPFFDIDLKQKDHPEHYAEIVDTDLALTKFIVKIGLKFGKKEDATISRAHRDGKISYHIIYNKILIRYADLRAFKDANTELFDECFVDRSVYRTYGKFRMLGTAKKEGDTVSPILEPLNESFDLKDHLITYINGDEKKIKIDIPKTIKIKKSVKNVEKNHCSNHIDMNSSYDNVEYIRDLLNLLDQKRWENHHDWMRICWSLCNTGNNLYPLLLEFSKKSKLYQNEKWVKDQWNYQLKKRYDGSIGTIKYYAKQDNPDAYFSLILKSDKNLFELLKKNLDEANIANVIHYLYKNVFICHFESNKRSSHWYHFENHRWQPQGHLSLRETVKNEISALYSKLISYYTELAIKSTDETEKQSYDNAINAIYKYIPKLRTVKQIDQHIIACEALFRVHTAEFFNMMDENRYLIGFNNGVFDLKNRIFRDGLPEDLVSFSVGYDFPTESNPEIREDIDKFFKDIFKDEDEVIYTKNVLSYVLQGIRDREKFNIWIGRARNGKGTLIELLKTCLGNYVKEMDVSHLCSVKDSAEGASSSLAKAKGKRLLVFSEAEEGKKLNNATIKRWTGGDRLEARQLYGESFEFLPQFHIIIQTNNQPEVRGLDDGYYKRVEMTEFPFSFVENPSHNFQKLRDSTLKSKFRDVNYGKEFMLMLIDNYYNNKVFDGFKTSQRSIEATNEYTNDIDNVKQFIQDQLVMTNDPKDRIKSNELFLKFKSTGIDINMNDRIFKSHMNRNGIINKRYTKGVFFLGVKYKEEDKLFEEEE